MGKHKVVWQPRKVDLICPDCFMDLGQWSIEDVKRTGVGAIKCRNCRVLLTLPQDLLAHTEFVKADFDPDNPLGRAAAWDTIIGNPMLKRAIEIALVGYHTLTYVGHPRNGWQYVQAILGDRATFMARCPCGSYKAIGQTFEQACICTLKEIADWQQKATYRRAILSDIIVEVYPPRAEEFFSVGEPYSSVLARLREMRLAQSFGVRAGIFPESRNGVRAANPVAFDLLNEARIRLSFTSEMLLSVQRVACTIAEMEGKTLVEGPHMAEAIIYRVPLADAD